MKKKMTRAEAGRLGGLKKNPKKGFGTNTELARTAPKEYWAKQRKAKGGGKFLYEDDLSIEKHAEVLEGEMV